MENKDVVLVMNAFACGAFCRTNRNYQRLSVTTLSNMMQVLEHPNPVVRSIALKRMPDCFSINLRVLYSAERTGTTSVFL
jgi:hypothetical protein